MNQLISENTIQKLTTSTCGLFQLYLYRNLFDPDEKLNFKSSEIDQTYFKN